MTTLTWPPLPPTGGYGTSVEFDVTGNDDLGSGAAMFGTVNLAANSHLVVTGNISFFYAEQLTGDPSGSITNNGSIMTENGTISVPIDGNGTLGLSGYHDGHGFSTISAPISSSQTVELSGRSFGMTLTLADPADFHGLLKIDPVSTQPSLVTIVFQGVHATSFTASGDTISINDGNQTIKTLRVDNISNAPITANFDGDATLTFHTPMADQVTTMARQFYQGALGRDADPGGLAFWTNELKTGALTPRDFVLCLTGSPEGQSRYGQQGDSQYVDSVYANALGRQADPGGHAAWTGLLQAGCARGDVMAAIAQSPEGQQHFALMHG